jgi:hypothetical protein
MLLHESAKALLKHIQPDGGASGRERYRASRYAILRETILSMSDGRRTIIDNDGAT